MIIASWQAVLTFALIVFLLLPLGRLSVGYRLATLLALVLIALIPLSSGLTLAGLLRGLTDDLAVTTLIWMASAALFKLGYMPPMPLTQKWPLWLCFSILGLVLYPAALGIGMSDTYSWGYNARHLIIVIGLMTLLLVWLRSRLGVALLVLATVAFLLGLKASENYWDYLLDPFIVLYSLGAMIMALAKAGWRSVSPVRGG